MFCIGNFLLQLFVHLGDFSRPAQSPWLIPTKKTNKNKTDTLHPLCIFKWCAYISVTSMLSANMQHVPNQRRRFATDMLGSTNFDGGQVIRQQLQLGVLFIMPPYLAQSVEEALDNCVAFLQILANDCSCLEIYSKLSVWLNLGWLIVISKECDTRFRVKRFSVNGDFSENALFGLKHKVYDFNLVSVSGPLFCA